MRNRLTQADLNSIESWMKFVQTSPEKFFVPKLSIDSACFLRNNKGQCKVYFETKVYYMEQLVTGIVNYSDGSENVYSIHDLIKISTL